MTSMMQEEYIAQLHFDLDRINVKNEQNNITLVFHRKNWKKHHKSQAISKRPLSKEYDILQKDTDVLQKDADKNPYKWSKNTTLIMQKQATDVFCKKFRKNFTKYTGKYLCWILFFNKKSFLKKETLS